MSSYYTPSALREALGEDRYIGIFDRDGDGVVGVEDEAFTLKAIRRGSSLADALIGSRYSVPLTGEQITEAWLDAVLDLIVYKASDDGDVMSETVVRNFNDAKKLIECMSINDAHLGDTANAPPSRVARARSSGASPVFTRANLKGLG